MPPGPVHAIVEDLLGCKWSLAVLAAVRGGVVRPGAIKREVAGISTKVMNQRLAKLTRYEVLVRSEFDEVPPHVEYHLTPFGERLTTVLDAIDKLEQHR